MSDDRLYEVDPSDLEPDPDERSVKDRRVYTQPYDLVVESLIHQIDTKELYLRPISERPSFQRQYVWSNTLASRLIESILLNVPIPPCYLSQNEDFELDVIDGQQRIYSIYRYVNNQFPLTGLEVLKELNDKRFHETPSKIQRQLNTHTLRCIAITNESHPEIKFDVFERLNSNTMPLNAQELRNCVYRGKLNDLLKEAVVYEPWLEILGKKKPDKRMRDEELVLRFFAFHMNGLKSYRTPQKHWLNEVAKEGRKFTPNKIEQLYDTWTNAIDTCLEWFSPKECFRRPDSKAINRALFDLLMYTASQTKPEDARQIRKPIRSTYKTLLADEDFIDLIRRSVDHTKRTKQRFKLWEEAIEGVF